MRARRVALLGIVLGLGLAPMATALGGFAPPVYVPIEGGCGIPTAVAAGDIDRDGHQDLVVASPTSQTMTVLLGDGTRRFRRGSTSPIPVSHGAWSVALADVNGDGWLDLVTTNGGSHDITILDGLPGGTFAPGWPVHVEGLYPGIVATGDLDGDGRLDLVASGARGDLTLLVNEGSGRFTPIPGPRLNLESWVSSLALRDVNGDGRLDILAVTYPEGRTRQAIIALFGTGGLGFVEAPGSPARLPGVLAPAAFGDVDRDGQLDVVALDGSTLDLVIFQGDGAGGFQLRSRSRTSSGYFSPMVLLDANHDGVLDLATIDANALSLRLGNVSGGFIEPPEPPLIVGVDVEGVATIDLDGDGRLDLVTANSRNRTVSFLRQDATGRFSEIPGSPVAVELAPTVLAPGPQLGGRVREVVMRGWDGFADFVGVLLADENGVFSPAPSPPYRHDLNIAAIGDVDGDGWLDLVTREAGIDILLGGPDGSFTRATGPSDLIGDLPFLVDLTGDGRLDLVVSSRSEPSLAVLRGDGRGGFAPVAGSPFSVALRGPRVTGCDVNGDGRVDLVALGHLQVSPYSYALAVLLGDGSGTFPPAQPVPVALPDPADVQATTAADLNGDGRTDLVLSGNGVYVLIGDGLGRFTPSAVSPVYPAHAHGSSSVSVSDLDRDGRPDLTIADGVTSRVALLRNTTVPPASLTAIAETPQEVAVLNPLPTALRVLVRDAAGSPVPDVVVTFTAPGSGASGSFPGGTTALTSALGEASVPFTANQTTGTYDVTASVSPYPVPPATLRLTNVEVSIRTVPASISRGASSRSTIARIAGRDPGRLTVTTTFVPPGLTVTDLSRSGNEITGVVSAACDAPLGRTVATLRLSDGVNSATSDLVVEATPDATPPRVLPSPVQALVSQSTCAGGGGATLASLGAHHPIEYQALRALIENARIIAVDNCTAHPARLPPQRVADPSAVSGVDITDATVFPFGTSFVRFGFRDDELNVGITHGLVAVSRSGDLNSVAGVTLFDTIVLASYLVGNIEPGTDPFVAPLSAADVNVDGVVDVFDLLLVTSYIVGNVECLAP